MGGSKRSQTWILIIATGGLVVEKMGGDEMKITWQKIGWSSSDWIGMFRPYTLDAELYIAKFNVKGMRSKGGRKEGLGRGERKQKSPGGIVNIPFLLFLFSLIERAEHLDVKMYPIPYGDIVFRYFRSDNNMANSETVSFGMHPPSCCSCSFTSCCNSCIPLFPLFIFPPFL